LVDWKAIEDPVFRAAVKAVQEGDIAGLNALMDRHPDLLAMRNPDPDGAPKGYFSNAKLFWYVANNPILIDRPPRNIIAVAEAMIARGIEQADLDYALMLTMTGNSLRKRRLQTPMITALMRAGASPGNLRGVLGHKEIAAVETVLKAGYPMTAPVAAGTGRLEDLARLLPAASAEERHDAFSAAVINGHVACAQMCLDAGAEVSALLSMHAHSTAAHQAAINGDIAMLELLVARGADLSARDTMWNGTPLGWAIHERKRKARAFLESVLRGRESG
jgi:peptide-methionine (S)-S-oxide reductase